MPMIPAEVMSSSKRTARIAGLLYLTVVISGFFSIAYVPSQLIVRGDAASTISNLEASRQLYQMGIVAGVICYTAFLVLPLVLYRLLSSVSRNAAALMVAFAVVSVPLALVNLRHQLDVLSLLNRSGLLHGLSIDQLHTQVLLSLEASRNGALITEVFWGLWLLPFGYLVFRSGFLPRILGVFLMLGCFGYLINCLGRVLSPGYSASTFASLISIPSAIGEIGTCLWLVVAGVRVPRSHAVTAADAI